MPMIYHLANNVNQCLHPDCTDFDLCQNCEAIPIPVHPLSHPLVRVKVPETHIPSIRTPDLVPLPPLTALRNHPYQQLAMQSSVSDIQSPRPVFMPVPSTEREAHGSFAPQNQEQEHGPYCEPTAAPAMPRLIPACWTPPEIDWRWNMTPPGPMVVPNMLASEETTPLMDQSFQNSHAPEQLNPLMHSSEAELTGFAELIQPTLLHPVRSTPIPISSTPNQYSPTLLPRSPPPPLRPLDFDDELASVLRGTSTPDAVSSVGLTTPSNGAESPVALIQPPPRIDSVGDQEWRELWPELTTILRHLLQPTTPPATTVGAPAMPVPVATEVPATPATEVEAQDQEQTEPASAQEFRTAGTLSPINIETNVERTLLEASQMVERSREFGRNLFDYMNGVIPPLPAPVPARHQATYISDNNIQDGQVFPPGAEFVKSWIMRNDGETAWPEETTLRYVAGDRMAPREGATMRVPIGTVLPGADAELVGGEMKVRSSVVYSMYHLT